MVRKLDIYVLRQILKPLLMTLGVAALLLLLERMLRLFDIVINEGGPFLVVWKMLASLVPQYLGLAVPVGLLLGVLIGFRKLALDSEIDALQASGLGVHTVLRPALALAFVLILFSIALFGWIQPMSRYSYEGLLFDLRSGALGASLKIGEFSRVGEGMTLRIDESQQGGGKLTGIFAQKEENDGTVITATAREGAFLSTTDHEAIILRLREGLLLIADRKHATPSIVAFQSHDFPILLPKFQQFRDRGAEQLELTLPELWHRTMTEPGDPNWNSWRAALHARIVRALSLIFMPFLAIPLGFVNKRSGVSLGLPFGVITLLVYNKILEFGQASSQQFGASPWLTLWLPTAAFMALSLWLFYVAAFRVGARPLGWLEDGWATLAASARAVTALLRRRVVA